MAAILCNLAPICVFRLECTFCTMALGVADQQPLLSDVKSSRTVKGHQPECENFIAFD